MGKKDGEVAMAAVAGIAASKAIESERRQDEVDALGDSIPEGERASKIFRMRVQRLKKPGTPGGNVWANVGDYMFVAGDNNWYDATKTELVAKYGPGDYDGTPCDANKKTIEKAPHWTFKVGYDEALALGWIDPSIGTTGTAQASAPVKNKVEEARERVALLKEELELAALKKQLAEVQGEVKNTGAADAGMQAKVDAMQAKVAEAEKKAELAKQEAAHRDELAKRDRERSDMQSKFDQQQRDLDAIKHQLANPNKPPVDVGQEVAKALDTSLGKISDKAAGFATLFAPVLGAIITRLTEKAPAPPAPPPPPDYIAIITALKNTIQPQTTVDPFAAIDKITASMANIRKAAVPDDDGPDEEEILDRELNKMKRLKEFMGGGKSTISEVGEIANGTLRVVGDTIARVAGARAGMSQEPVQDEAARQRLLRKRRQLAQAKRSVIQDPPTGPTQVTPEDDEVQAEQPAPQAASADPTPKDWAALALGLTKAMKAKADPAKVARALNKKFAQVAKELVKAPSIQLVEIGLSTVAGKMGRPYGIAVNELASELRKEDGAAWGGQLLAELKKLAQGQQSEDAASEDMSEEQESV